MRTEYLNLRIILYFIFISFITYCQINLPKDFISNNFSLYNFFESEDSEEQPSNLNQYLASTLSTADTNPLIVLSNPVSGSSLMVGDSVNIAATVNAPTSGTPYYKINCPDLSYRKLKIGYNSTSLYSPTYNVTAGGNNKVEITFKDVTTINWSKIQIRPQGNSTTPLVIGNYIATATIMSDGFKKITIPLSSFNSTIDFTKISNIEFPYSAGAGVFEMQLQSIVFTGGTTPYNWFGNGKTDNIQDGLGGGGQLLASLVVPVVKTVSQVVFYQNSILLGSDNSSPYQYTWKNLALGTYNLTATVQFADGTNSVSDPVTITVQPIPVGGLKVTIVFDQVPQNYSITNAALKYNKDFSYSFTLDDGKLDAYTRAYPVLAGGYIDFNKTTYPGLFYTDGCGNDIPFTAGLAWNSQSSDGNDPHNGAPGSMTWTQLKLLYSKNWNVFNHSLTHAAGTGTNYVYQVTENTRLIKEKAGITTSHFVIPSGDSGYEQPAFNNGMVAVYNQASNYPGVNGLKIDGPINLFQFKLNRKFISDDKYNKTNITSAIDNVAGLSKNGSHYWYNDFTHRVGETPYGGSLIFSTFEYYMKYVESTYGKSGKDNIWMAPLQDVYEYIKVRNTIKYSTKLTGNRLEIVLDTANVPKDLLKYALSLSITSDATFSAIETNGFIWTSFNGNGNLKLVNLEWKGNPQSIVKTKSAQSDDDDIQSKVGQTDNGSLQFSAFPNPVEDNLIIEMGTAEINKVNLKLFDNAGLLLYNQEYDLNGGSKIQMNIADLKKGIYFLKIQSGETLFETRKIVKN